MRRPKKNPKFGKHPDLYERQRVSATQIDEYPADTEIVVEDWRVLSPDELRAAAEHGQIADEDYNEMEEYEEQASADGDIDALVKDGLSKNLARAVAGGLRDELLDLDEASRERRTQPFIDYIRDGVKAALAQEFGDEDGGNIDNESFVDSFQSDLESEGTGHLIKAAEQVSDHAATIIQEEQIDEATLEEILKDPGLYDLERKDDEYGRPQGSVWSAGCGSLDDPHEGVESRHGYDGVLKAMLNGGDYETDDGHGGNKKTTSYPGMSSGDLYHALTELDKHEPYISITTWKPHLDSIREKDRAKFTVDSFDEDFTLHSSYYESSRIHAILNGERLDAALNAKIEEQGGAAKPQGKESDDIAYEYAGTNDSVGGASARGMYVARLKVKDLKRESAVLGHCIGNEANGHPKALRDGKTQVFSIRTEVGKPKFTIELRKEYGDIPSGRLAMIGSSLWSVAEVKGKANRQPGFEAGKDVFTKPDDLRLVTDFLLSLGYSPEALKDVRDIAPGIKAAEEKGMDPFAPPPRKVRAPRPQTNPSARDRPSAAVARLLARTRPMGRFRG